MGLVFPRPEEEKNDEDDAQSHAEQNILQKVASGQKTDGNATVGHLITCSQFVTN